MSTEKTPYKTACTGPEQPACPCVPSEPTSSRAHRLLACVRRTLRRWRRMLAKGCGLFMLGIVAIVGCVACTTPAPPPPAQGSVFLTWAIQDQNRLFTTCERVGASTVRLQLRNQAGVTSAISFPCVPGSGTSALATGTYQVTPELVTASGRVLATVASQSTTVTAGQLSRLASAVFAASTQGQLVLSFTAPPNTSNCTAPNQGGAGITSSSLTVVGSDGLCAPVIFIRTRGATQLGTYQVNCSSPPAAACFEHDELLTTRLAPGGYALHARGKIAGTDCWRSDETIQVPGPGDPLAHAVRLAHQSLPGC